jgi:hypothetical protein
MDALRAALGHLFVDGVDAAAHEAALKAWLDGVYAPQRVP